MTPVVTLPKNVTRDAADTTRQMIQEYLLYGQAFISNRGNPDGPPQVVPAEECIVFERAAYRDRMTKAIHRFDCNGTYPDGSCTCGLRADNLIAGMALIARGK